MYTGRAHTTKQLIIPRSEILLGFAVLEQIFLYDTLDISNPLLQLIKLSREFNVLSSTEKYLLVVPTAIAASKSSTIQNL